MNEKYHKSPVVIEGYSVGEGLPLPLGVLKQACWEDIHTEELEVENLAKVLSDVEGLVSLVWSGTGVTSPVQILMGLFPHRGFSSARSIDELPSGTRSNLSKDLNTIIEKASQVSQNNGFGIDRIYVCQHFAPEDSNHQMAFAQSFTQLHFHIFVDPVNYEHGQRVSSENSFVEQSETLDRRSVHNSIHDPTAIIMYDLLKHLDTTIEFDSSTSSIIICNEQTTEISKDDLDKTAQMMQLWKSEWDILARCFTDFEVDSEDRYLPVECTVRKTRVENYIAHHEQLSSQSKRILRFLALHVKEADWRKEQYWSNFYRGVSGSLVISINPTLGEHQICLVPRTRICISRTIGVNRVQKVFIKTRTRQFTDEQSSDLLRIQRELIGAL